MNFRPETQLVTNKQLAITKMEKRYSQLKRRIDEYKDEEDRIWISLNDPFSFDLDKLGVALMKYFRVN